MLSLHLREGLNRGLPAPHITYGGIKGVAGLFLLIKPFLGVTRRPTACDHLMTCIMQLPAD